MSVFCVDHLQSSATVLKLLDGGLLFVGGSHVLVQGIRGGVLSVLWVFHWPDCGVC